jgi:hypothetical protein
VVGETSLQICHPAPYHQRRKCTNISRYAKSALNISIPNRPHNCKDYACKYEENSEEGPNFMSQETLHQMDAPADSNIRAVADAQFHTTFLRDTFIGYELILIIFWVVEEVHEVVFADRRDQVAGQEGVVYVGFLG